MTSREIVRRTLDFDHPDRVARSFGESDFISARCESLTFATEWEEIRPNVWERKDEWGNTWGRIDPTSKGEVVRGAITELERLEDYVFPDYSNPADYEGVRARRAEYSDQWLIGGLPGFAFNIARKMRKLEQYLVDLLLERGQIHELHDRIDAVLADMIRNYADAGVDAVMFPEDWGTQTQTLISPGLWGDEFYPRFESLCGLAHERGIRVFMHSCGAIGEIIPGLIRAGVDLLQFDQPDLHGTDTLASFQELDHITFWCPVDIQQTLQTRDEQIIADKAEEMLDKLWRGRGGFVAGYYSDNPSIGLDPKWQALACSRFTTLGIGDRYRDRAVAT